MKRLINFLIGSITDKRALSLVNSNLDESIAEYVPEPIIHNPILMIGVGALVTVIFGVSFARLMQKKLINWEQEKISPLPLGSWQTSISWAGALMGLTLFSTGTLQIVDFDPLKSLFFSLTFAILSGVIMWRVINDLMIQVAKGEVKEFDDYF